MDNYFYTFTQKKIASNKKAVKIKETFHSSVT